MPRLCCDGRSRRVFLADTSLGLTGLVLGTMLPRRVLRRRDLDASRRQAAFPAESQARDLAVHAGRRAATSRRSIPSPR